MFSARLFLIPSLITLTLTLAAEDNPIVVPPPANAAIPVAPGALAPASNWTFTGRLGAYIANVSTSNADTSRDTTIATASRSTS